MGTWELVLPALKLRPRLFQMLYTAEKGPCKIQAPEVDDYCFISRHRGGMGESGIVNLQGQLRLRPCVCRQQTEHAGVCKRLVGQLYPIVVQGGSPWHWQHHWHREQSS